MVDKEFAVNKSHTIRVGFILPAGSWRGGRNYLLSLFSALQTLPGNPITPVILSGQDADDVSSDFPDVEVVRTAILDRKSLAWLVQKVFAKVTTRDIILQRLLRKHDISVLSHCLRLDGKIGIATLGWIPDFQHIHLQQFFSEQERHQRDREFMDLCVRCNKVIVSSECARADLRAFSPQHENKAELLHFVADPAPVTSAVSLSDVKEKYGFTGPYFVLPNQFWAHKNHRVVLNALQILKQRNQPLLVLATGSSKDSRDPSYFPSLMQYAEECKVLDYFRVLGIVPFPHLVELMRNSIALINSSRFEGWSTSVEEAKSMGKQILLSDIPVHREQAPERGIYFPAENPDALAEAMIAAYNGFDAAHDATMQDEARARFPERQREFGSTYSRIISRFKNS
jgi:glycosyltransferase involved in cell wall biosynthesis